MILQEPNYRIVKKLSSGQNQHGDVYLIEIRGELYVLKTFTVDKAESLESEVKIGMMLNHPNLNRVEGYWYDSYENTTKVIFDYVENDGTLDNFIVKGDGVPFIGKVEIALALASAVNYLHSQQIFHRDIKTKNIIITSRGEPILIDYDLSCIYNERYTHARVPKYPGDIMCRDEFAGTINYMHPSFIAKNVNGTYVDIYGLALVFLCLFGGFEEPPYPTPRQGEDIRDFFIHQKKGNRDFNISVRDRCIYQNGRAIIPHDSRLFRYPYLCEIINRMIRAPFSISAKGLESSLGMFVEGYETSRE